jgi:hypothetical protein
MISANEVKRLSNQLDVPPSYVEKDYVRGWLLWGIYANPILAHNLVLKRGNCLRKVAFFGLGFATFAFGERRIASTVISNLQPYNPQQKIIRWAFLTSPPLPPLQNRIHNPIRKIHTAIIPNEAISKVSYPIVDRESASHECNVLILSNRRAFRISKQNIYLIAFHCAHNSYKSRPFNISPSVTDFAICKNFLLAVLLYKRQAS